MKIFVKGINIGKYKNPEKVGFLCWIKSKNWCVFIDNDGNLIDINGKLINSGLV